MGLATTSHSFDNLKEQFLELASDTFERTRGDHVTLNLDAFNFASLTMMVLQIHKSLYRTAPLRKSLKKALTEDRKLFSPAYRPVKAAVITVKDNGETFCFMANYNRPDTTGSLDFEREDGDKEVKVWDAGLATSAALFYFKPYGKDETRKSYVDGALFANLPVPFALDEMKRVFDRQHRLDVLVPIRIRIQKEEPQIPSRLQIAGLEKLWASFQTGLNTERTWESLLQRADYPPELLSRVKRINSWINEPYVNINGYRRMESIADDVLKRSKHPRFEDELRTTAESLLAGLFFFEPTQPPRGTTWREKNHIKGKNKMPTGTRKSVASRASP